MYILSQQLLYSPHRQSLVLVLPQSFTIYQTSSHCVAFLNLWINYLHTYWFWIFLKWKKRDDGGCFVRSKYIRIKRKNKSYWGLPKKQRRQSSIRTKSKKFILIIQTAMDSFEVFFRTSPPPFPFFCCNSHESAANGSKWLKNSLLHKRNINGENIFKIIATKVF